MLRKESTAKRDAMFSPTPIQVYTVYPPNGAKKREETRKPSGYSESGAIAFFPVRRTRLNTVPIGNCTSYLRF